MVFEGRTWKEKDNGDDEDDEDDGSGRRKRG